MWRNSAFMPCLNELPSNTVCVYSFHWLVLYVHISGSAQEAHCRGAQGGTAEIPVERAIPIPTRLQKPVWWGASSGERVPEVSSNHTRKEPQEKDEWAKEKYFNGFFY